MNPEFFDIENLKMFGLWPNGIMLSGGIIPYIKRRRGDITINMIDDFKGESTFDIIEQCANVNKVYILNKDADANYDTPFKTNLKNLIGDKVEVGSLSNEADIVCVHRSSCDKLQEYYDTLKIGGIFCGNDHDTDEVKKALNVFRRGNKIGTPIQISNLAIWFWIKG
jgi:hypothetical protein